MCRRCSSAELHHLRDRAAESEARPSDQRAPPSDRGLTRAEFFPARLAAKECSGEFRGTPASRSWNLSASRPSCQFLRPRVRCAARESDGLRITPPLGSFSWHRFERSRRIAPSREDRGQSRKEFGCREYPPEFPTCGNIEPEPSQRSRHC